MRVVPQVVRTNIAKTVSLISRFLKMVLLAGKQLAFLFCSLYLFGPGLETGNEAEIS